MPLNLLTQKLEGLERCLREVPVVEKVPDDGWQTRMDVSLLENMKAAGWLRRGVREVTRAADNLLEALKRSLH